MHPLTTVGMEEERLRSFPVARKRIFLGHAGVTALPSCAAEAMKSYVSSSSEDQQEFGGVLKEIELTRRDSAALLGAEASEIALLGPTSLGLSLFANGIDWKNGDEVVIYGDDYPANVYPWLNLQSRGVVIRWLETETLGKITPDCIEASLTPATRLVALASCHFQTGWRIDVPAIGALLRKQGILFSLDAIQTLGAFPTPATEVDFLSADAHKWLLGPLAAGIVYVAKERFNECRPTLLGSWNIKSPDFLTQKTIEFEEGGRRYEPGVLNVAGIYGMRASINLIRERGIEVVSSLILERRDQLETGLASLGFDFLSPRSTEPLRSGILTTRHPGKAPSKLYADLEKASISASYRRTRDHGFWLRFSPHFYNTRSEIDRVLDVLSDAIKS
ncbi:MAG: aminotransferase class V-fold PLP-dependent enzyme [bacterium]